MPPGWACGHGGNLPTPWLYQPIVVAVVSGTGGVLRQAGKQQVRGKVKEVKVLRVIAAGDIAAEGGGLQGGVGA